MSKPKTSVKEFRAEARFQRTSPQKVRLVLETIKGLRVEQAINAIHFSTKRMAPVVEKVLQSAIANATHVSSEQGLDVDVDNLYVRTALANDGPRLKRIRPAPMGRAFRYQRRLCHVIVTVAEKGGIGTGSARAAARPEAEGRAKGKLGEAKKSPSKKKTKLAS